MPRRAFYNPLIGFGSEYAKMCVRRIHDQTPSYSDEFVEGKRRFERHFEKLKVEDVYEYERRFDPDWILNHLSESSGITCLPIYDVRFHDLARYGWSLNVRHRTPRHPGISRPKISFESPGKNRERLVLHVRAMPILTDDKVIGFLESGHFSMAKERLLYARPHISELDIVKKMNDERYERVVKKIELDVKPIDIETIDIEDIVVNLDKYRKPVPDYTQTLDNIIFRIG